MAKSQLVQVQYCHAADPLEAAYLYHADSKSYIGKLMDGRQEFWRFHSTAATQKAVADISSGKAAAPIARLADLLAAVGVSMSLSSGGARKPAGPDAAVAAVSAAGESAPAAPKKRGRKPGRKPGKKSAGRRGRPPGSKNKAAAPKAAPKKAAKAAGKTGRRGPKSKLTPEIMATIKGLKKSKATVMATQRAIKSQHGLTASYQTVNKWYKAA